MRHSLFLILILGFQNIPMGTQSCKFCPILAAVSLYKLLLFPDLFGFLAEDNMVPGEELK